MGNILIDIKSTIMIGLSGRNLNLDFLSDSTLMDLIKLKNRYEKVIIDVIDTSIKSQNKLNGIGYSNIFDKPVTNIFIEDNSGEVMGINSIVKTYGHPIGDEEENKVNYMIIEEAIEDIKNETLAIHREFINKVVRILELGEENENLEVSYDEVVEAGIY